MEEKDVPSKEESRLINLILSNGARFYVDHAHPEYSSPETTNPRDLVIWDRAGERVLNLARQHPVIIQSLFPAVNSEEPPLEEIEQYAQRLLELKNAGAQIPFVQIYSATRPTATSECGHLPLKVLSRIALTVRQTTGLRAEVF